MRFHSVQTRFLLAGILLVMTTVGSGVWSVVMFARLSAAIRERLHVSHETIDLTASLADTLEREDDALHQAISGNLRNARSEVAQRRQDFDEDYTRLVARLDEREERQAARALRDHADAYRELGDTLLERAALAAHSRGYVAAQLVLSQPPLLTRLLWCADDFWVRPSELYQQQVNPALRKAVADCSRIRKLNFQSMHDVEVDASNETRRAMGIMAGIALVALGLSTIVTVRLAQVILRPIRELTRSVEAIRRDDFKCRVHVDSEDELGQLAAGFNRMAETLGEYRESSLGELLLAKATLEATLAALPDAVIVVDPDGQIVSQNPLAVDILKAIGGKDALRFAELPLPPAVLRDVSDTLRDGHAGGARPDLSQSLSVPLHDRRLKMLVTVVPIPDFLPRRAGAAIVFADVTEFARLDELRTDVVAVASHELKTPLTSLQMNLLLLQEKADNLTPRQREILTAAVRGGEELGGTIDELLDLTRIEAGQLQLAHQLVDLAAVVEQVVRTLRPRYDDAEVALRVIKDVSQATVRGDAARLSIVFVNVLTNALKYTPRGGHVTVHLASTQNAAAGGKSTLQIAVTDTGCGVPAELRERIFEKFFRVEDQRPDGPKGVRGTGIGLYLCREIIEAHSGTIVCTAGDQGRGTRIAISLPPADGAN
jgi:NtrC-family two-component system sensor histidine kinase KinB